MQADFYEQPFLRHFLDAILLTEMAEDLPHMITGRHAALARGSILAATLSVEAAANSLLEPLQAPKGILRLIDQAPVLDKFEMVLFATQPGKTFDRGAKLMQAMDELFRIRNKYVHPRSQDTQVTQRLLGEGTVTISDTAKVSNSLHLPSSPERWGATHSRLVLGAVSDFLDHYLLDLCELQPAETRALLLSSLTSDQQQRIILTREQRDILIRACVKFDFQWRVARLIAGEDATGSPAPTINLLVLYSWAKGGLQLHEQKKLLMMDDATLSSETIIAAAQRFFVWFAEAQGLPYGRRLLMFEIFDENQEMRYASFREFMPEPADTTKDESATHRPIGAVPGVERHLFFNGVLSARASDPEGVIVLEALLDSGDGREFRLPPKTALEFLEGIRLNRSREWVSEGVATKRPEKVETKGRDFEVAESDIVAFDPTSRTAFWTYKAASGQHVQVNMKPSTLMAMHEVLRRAWLDTESNRSGTE